jgi:hypothetical protein
MGGIGRKGGSRYPLHLGVVWLAGWSRMGWDDPSFCCCLVQGQGGDI